MAARNWQPSVIEYFFDPKGPSGSECGYCSGKTGICNVMWAHRLTCLRNLMPFTENIKQLSTIEKSLTRNAEKILLLVVYNLPSSHVAAAA
jgi:hypothetical protein